MVIDVNVTIIFVTVNVCVSFKRQYRNLNVRLLEHSQLLAVFEDFWF